MNIDDLKKQVLGGDRNNPQYNTKQAVLKYMRGQSMRPGHTFNAKGFFITVYRTLTPPEQDALEPALDSLTSDGVFEKRNDGHYALTEAGYQALYSL